MSGRKTETTENELTSVPAAAPKKRGRPKRTPAPETAQTKAAEAEPPKRKNVSAAPKDDNSTNAAAKADGDASPAPKKRGRPRKAPEASADAKPQLTEAEPAPDMTQTQNKPRKTSARSKAKKQDAAVGDISSKTPQVMRLVQQGNDMVNPTIMAGKSSIPRKLRGLEPLTKIMKREAEEIFGTDQEDETFNLTALVIDDSAAEILRRFNACDCEVCVEQLSQLTADIVPARFAKLKRRAVERNAPEVEELKAPLRRSVTSQMIRLVIRNKKRSFHDQ